MTRLTSSLSALVLFAIGCRMSGFEGHAVGPGRPAGCVLLLAGTISSGSSDGRAVHQSEGDAVGEVEHEFERFLAGRLAQW